MHPVALSSLRLRENKCRTNREYLDIPRYAISICAETSVEKRRARCARSGEYAKGEEDERATGRFVGKQGRDRPWPVVSTRLS